MRQVTVLAVLAAVVLGGCAGETDEPAPGGTVTPSISPSPSFPEDLPTPTASPTGPGPQTSPKSTRRPPGRTEKPTNAEMTISGQVVAGVEAGCRLIDGYLLLAGPGINRDSIRVGATMTVRGRVERGMMTTCQQGTPFVVTEIVSS